MADDVKFRVRLDTTNARSEMRALRQDGERTSRSLAGSLRETIGKGFRAVGVGAALGTGFSAVRGATSSGIGDVLGETFGPIGAWLNDFFLGSIDDEARASRRAREEATQAFGLIAGARGEIPPQARTWFESVKAIRLQEERGKTLFAADPQFYGPGFDKVIDRIMEKLAELLSMAVDKLADALVPAWMR